MTPEQLQELLASLANMTPEQILAKRDELLSQAADAVKTEDDAPITMGQAKLKRELTAAANEVTKVYNDFITAEDVDPVDAAEKPEPKAEEDDKASADPAADATADQVEKAETPEVVAEGEGGNAGVPEPQGAPEGAGEKVEELAPVLANAFAHAPYEPGTALDDSMLVEAIKSAALVPDAVTVVATVNGYDPDMPRLGADPVANQAILYPNADGINDITAAVCGPVQPIAVIPECFRSGEPMGATFTTAPTSFGQIQIYEPQGLGTPAGIDLDAASCVDCDETPADPIDCLQADCILPGAPVGPKPYLACLCVDEELAFSNPIVLQHHLRRLTAFWDQQKELRRMERVRAQSYVRRFTAPYGSAAGVHQAIAQVKSAIMADPRFTGEFSNYIAFIPGGHSMFSTVMADIGNRFSGSANLGDDVLAGLQELGVGQVVMGLDHEVNSSTAGFTAPTGFTGALGNGGAADLEEFTQFGTIYLYRREDFLVASPFDIQIGLDTREKSEIPNGCMKLYRREYWIEPLKFGCNPSVVLDFSGLCASGSGPDRQTPICAGSVAGGGGAPLA